MPNDDLFIEREVMTLAEAADFLRLSKSTLYQRGDIPRHRLPGSRELRYLRSELLGWLKAESAGQSASEEVSDNVTPVVALAVQTKSVYHRNPRYRP